MMLRVLLLSFICCEFDFEFLIFYDGSDEISDSLTLTCKADVMWPTVELIDRDTRKLKYYHQTSPCTELYISNGLSLKPKSGISVRNEDWYIFACPEGEQVCKFMLPGPKQSIYIKYTNPIQEYQYASCNSLIKFYSLENFGSQADAYKNIPVVGSDSDNCEFLINSKKHSISLSDISTRETIVKNDAEEHITVKLPKPEEDIETGKRYIFKVTISNYGSYKLHLIAMCMRRTSDGGCFRFETRINYKINLDGVSFTFHETSLHREREIYIKFSIWRIQLNHDHFLIIEESSISYRINENILESLERKVFLRAFSNANMHFHMLKCEELDEGCNNDESREVNVTIYGISKQHELAELRIQWVEVVCKEIKCEEIKSRCSCMVEIAKNLNVMVEYLRVDGCSEMLLASDHYHTIKCEGISIDIAETLGT